MLGVWPWNASHRKPDSPLGIKRGDMWRQSPFKLLLKWENHLEMGTVSIAGPKSLRRPKP